MKNILFLSLFLPILLAPVFLYAQLDGNASFETDQERAQDRIDNNQSGANENSYDPEKSGLIPCGFDENKDGVVSGNERCSFNDLLRLANRLIDFAILISVPIFILLFMYAGFLYITASGNPGKIQDAHGLFVKGIIGFVIIISAWLIVNLIVSALVDDEAGINTFLS
ncbi:MAG: pilin [Candidatus Paceibacterota bacterium]